MQTALLAEGCLQPLLVLVKDSNTLNEVKKEVARFLALLTGNVKNHELLLRKNALKCINDLIIENNDLICQRFASLSLGNITVSRASHEQVINSGVLQQFIDMSKSKDTETKRCVAFTIHNIASNKSNIAACERLQIMPSVVNLLHCKDFETKLQACLAVKLFSSSPRSRVQFVEAKGLTPLLRLATLESSELTREFGVALQNLSLSDDNKVHIFKDGGFMILLELCHSTDEVCCHQACGVIANLAEAASIQEDMVKENVLHYLKFALRWREPASHSQGGRTRCFDVCSYGKGGNFRCFTEICIFCFDQCCSLSRQS